jgi:hypothetical protein
VKVLVACEFSGIVRDAFIAKGHDAVSCDLLPSERPFHPHIQHDVLGIIKQDWDLLIAHPPCTHLAVSGARWWASTDKNKRDEAILFFSKLAFAFTGHIPKVAIENPVGCMSTIYRKPDQYIQPWQFGEPETKKTGLWLKGLPKLKPTKIVSGRRPRVHFESPGPDRWKNRSRTLPGIAEAMAEQWG